MRSKETYTAPMPRVLRRSLRARTRVPHPRLERPAQRKRRALRIIERLRERYPTIRLPLKHRDPFQLLVSTILSAQTTDATVNRITPELFEKFKSPQDFATADPRDIERIIKPTGFFRQKTRSLQSMSRSLLERYEGRVPLSMAALLTLKGVGRKTANVLLSAKRLEPWGGGEDSTDGLGIVVDTHVRRLSQRLGLATSDDPAKIERQLMEIVPREEWDGFSLRLIYFGREVCTAQRPKCPICPLRALCPSSPYLGKPPWMRQREEGANELARKRASSQTRR